MSDQHSEENSIIKHQSEKSYGETMYFVKGLVSELTGYSGVIDALRNGKATVELRKRIMLRAIDETWVQVIEDSLTALDEIIRKPSHFIEEEEQILPIELTKTVSSRSIKHLTQHTDYISEIKGDDIIPSKLLNVFREETILTYENKFVNTLISRLYAFVSKRYDSALSSGEDTKNTSLEFKNEFEHGEMHGKISFRIEVEEKPSEGEVDKNYVMVSDLWKRVKKIRLICGDYMNSTFVKEVGNNFIRPPVMRTNAIRKNKNLRQCLALWEFIESYENAGFSTMVEDTLLDVDEEKIKEMYYLMSMQYMSFREMVDKGFDEEDELAHASVDAPLRPEIIEDLKPATVDEFHIHVAQIDETRALRTPEENEVLRALEVALLADQILLSRPEIEDRERYNRSFMARLILAQDPTQTFYTEIKNFLLSYKRVHNRMSWRCENFNYGRNLVSRFIIRGKTLIVCLPLDPQDEKYQIYKVADMSASSRYEKVPLALKIRNRKAVGIAIKLITEVLEKLEAKLDPKFVPCDYHYPLETKEELIARGLIKVNNKRLGDDSLDANGNPYTEEEETEEMLEKENEENEFEEPEDNTAAPPTPDNPYGSVYDRSFLARYILAQEPTQDYYNEIKNFALSYKKVHARISWKYENITLGRNMVARMIIRGKTLVVCLPLDPKDEKYQEYKTSDLAFSNNKKVPFALKIRSNRAVGIAIKLIAEILEGLGAQLDPKFVPEDYHLPYETKEELLERGLIKIDDKRFGGIPTGEEGAEGEEATEEIAEEPVEQVETVAEPAEVEPTENEGEGVPAVASANTFGSIYDRSYLARYILAQAPLQDFYNEIKNYALSYKKVHARISWKCENFTLGRNAVARFLIKGKTLVIYLPLDPLDEKYQDCRVDLSGNQKLPMALKIKSNRAVNVAIKLITEVLEGLETKPNPKFVGEDYHLPLETKEELIARGLIKVDSKRGEGTFVLPDKSSEEGEVAVVEDIQLTEGSEVAPAEESQPEEISEAVIVEETQFTDDEQVTQEEEVQAEIEQVETHETDELSDISQGISEENVAPAIGVSEGDLIVVSGDSAYGTIYNRSYLARYIVAQDPMQAFYTEIKNHLLSYKKVHSRISWKCENFTLGRNAVARFLIKGKTLVVCLPLDPNDEKYTEYRVDKSSYQKLPMCVKIKSNRAVNVAIKLITEVLEGLEAQLNYKFVPENYHLPLETKEQLLEKGLIKIDNSRLESILSASSDTTSTDEKQEEVVEEANAEEEVVVSEEIAQEPEAIYAENNEFTPTTDEADSTSEEVVPETNEDSKLQPEVKKRGFWDIIFGRNKNKNKDN